MLGRAKCYTKLREYLETVQLVDCHDHTAVCGPRCDDPLYAVAGGYFSTDLYSAFSDFEKIEVSTQSIEDRWPIYEKAWKGSCHTGYAQVIKRMLKKFYNEDHISLEVLKRLQGRLLDLTDPKVFEGILDEAKIVARLENILCEDVADVRAVLNGSFKLSPRGKLVIPLWPKYHRITNYESVRYIASAINRTVTSLEEYLDVCREIFTGFQRFGAVAFKDQCAYDHGLKFTNPSYSEAEKVFNWLMEDPRRNAGYPEQTAALEDYLFHEFMRMARDMDLPVQLHTGYPAGGRHDVTKTNASLLTSILELHREVRFDLLHANWPYSGEMLFLAKNYPNVYIDFSWAHMVDPIYCQNLIKQIISYVPHGKVHGYGSDFGGNAELAWAHASMARDNIAIGLSDMVEIEYLGLDEAKQIGREWLFNNPNAFFRLGL